MRASGPGRLADGGDALLVALREVADLDLEHGDALRAHPSRLLGQGLWLVPAPGDDLNEAVPGAAADEIAERPPERLALQVPERHLEGGAGSLVADRPQLALPAVHDGLEPERVLADHRRAEVLTDHVLDRPERVAGELVGRAGLSVPHESFVGLHAHEIAGARGQRRRGDDEGLLHLELERLHAHGGDLHEAPSSGQGQGRGQSTSWP